MVAKSTAFFSILNTVHTGLDGPTELSHHSLCFILISIMYKSIVIISGQYEMAVIKTNPVRNQLQKVPEKLFQLQRPDGKPGRAFAPPEIL